MPTSCLHTITPMMKQVLVDLLDGHPSKEKPLATTIQGMIERCLVKYNPAREPTLTEIGRLCALAIKHELSGDIV